MLQSGCAERITCHLRSKTTLELILAAPSCDGEEGGALPSLPGELAPAQTDTAKRCSDGCLNRLIGLVTGGTATDGRNEHAGRKTRHGRSAGAPETEQMMTGAEARRADWSALESASANGWRTYRQSDHWGSGIVKGCAAETPPPQQGAPLCF